MATNEQRERTPADEFRSWSMGAVWGAVFFIVVVACRIFTPWDALQQLLENQGVGEEGKSLLAFVAGYTFPLTLGTGVLTFLFLRGAFRHASLGGAAIAVGVILGAAGLLARALGLGLLPDYSGVTGVGGGPFRLLTLVLGAYLNAYGWALALSAAAIGFASGMQVERWMHEPESPERPESPEG
jgi:hypothetical protein